MYLLDTNIVIWILRGNKDYEDLLAKLKDKGELSISVITVAEIYKNVFQSEMPRTEDFIHEMRIFDVNENIAKLGGLYWQEFSKRFKNLHILDCILAATAREHDLVLVTLNKRHFPMKDIRILNSLN